jgi:hypothetical protein
MEIITNKVISSILNLALLCRLELERRVLIRWDFPIKQAVYLAENTEIVLDTLNEQRQLSNSIKAGSLCNSQKVHLKGKVYRVKSYRW